MSSSNIQFSSVAQWTICKIPGAASFVVGAGASTLSTIAPIVSKTLYTTAFVMYHASKMIPPTLSRLWQASKKAYAGARIAASYAVKVSVSVYYLYKNGGFNQIPAAAKQIAEVEQMEEGVEASKAGLLERVESLSAENDALKKALAQLKLENAQQANQLLEQQGQIEQMSQLAATLRAELENKKAIVEAPVMIVNNADEVAVESELSSIPAPPPLPIMKKARSSEAYKAAAADGDVEIVSSKKKDIVPLVVRPTMEALVAGRSLLKKQTMPAFTVSERKEANKNKPAEQHNELGAALVKGFLARNLKALREEEPEEPEEADW